MRSIEHVHYEPRTSVARTRAVSFRKTVVPQSYEHLICNLIKENAGHATALLFIYDFAASQITNVISSRRKNLADAYCQQEPILEPLQLQTATRTRSNTSIQSNLDCTRVQATNS